MSEKVCKQGLIKKTDFKIIVIGCYFGELRSDYKLFVRSIENNPSIDFLIFSNCKWGELPQNLKIVSTSFEDIRVNIESNFDFPICLDKPYKLCDYKPAFGEIFKSYIEGYDFWGHCDFDMIFGDLRAFITDEKLCNFDKIYIQGHLSLYRNTERVNLLYKQDGGDLNYRDVFSTNDICVFDEVDGIYHKCNVNGIRVYTKIEYIDIYPYINRMWQTRDMYHLNNKVPKNYSKQAFGYCDGHVYKWYKEKGIIKKKEYAYIHFSHKQFVTDNESDDFYLTSKGLITKNEGEEIPFEIFNWPVDVVRLIGAEFLFRLKRKIKKWNLI